jgi:hypothetical protein
MTESEYEQLVALAEREGLTLALTATGGSRRCCRPEAGRWARIGVARIGHKRGNFGNVGAGTDRRQLGALQMKIVSQRREQAD